MSRPLIAAVGLAYLWIAIESLYRGNYGMSILYGCYAGSNIGLWILAGQLP